jgi:PhzF family phenazine biosynthesis protein
MSRAIPFFVLDAFTDTPFAGNPAGVFFDDGACLSDEEMRRLAGEVSLESAFVLPATDGADLRLRYFTGMTEVPLCGHATVAALTALTHAGRVPAGDEVTLRVATPVGVLRVALTRTATGGVDVTLFQNPPVFGPVMTQPQVAAVARALGCGPDALAATGLPVQRVSTGTPWLFAPVASRAAVDNAPHDRAAILRLSREHETFGVYVFTVEWDGETGDLATWGRCFAPVAGLNEDPVTGSASGALGAYLWAHGRLDAAVSADGLTRFLARQGFAGGRGGVVRIAVGPETVAVSGSAVLVAEGTFRLP